MAIGQGWDWATPLQMANVAATIANGGTLLRPRVVDHITGAVVPKKGVLNQPQVIQPFVPSIVRRNVLNPDNLALIQEGMHMSVTPLPYGTSWNVVDPRIDAAGKTGTAEDSTGNGAPDAWWIGYAPFKHPKVAVCVLVPNANAEGAYVAAPIAHKMLEDYFRLAPLKKNWLIDVQQLLVPSAGGTQ
jgi:cell division protein FtsI/penicillin-binding protein 2